MRVLVAEINLVALLDDQLAFARLGGGVDFGEEDSGGRIGFGGGDFDGRIGVDLNLDFDFVALLSDDQVEIDDFGDDALAGFDAQELLP